MLRLLRFLVILLALSMVGQALAGAPLFDGDAPDGTSSSRSAPPFDGGDGSYEDPFWISTVEQLQNMSANLSAHYALVADVDASATEEWGNGTGFAPIGSSNHKYSGTFNGNGYAISDLTINRSGGNGVALFGGLGRGSRVEDVTLVNPRVFGKYYVGSVAGYSQGKVYGCTAINVTVIGSLYVGGMIGYSNWISEMNCRSSGRVIGTSLGGLTSGWKLDDIPQGGSNIGGLIGGKARGWITGSSAYADVSGDYRIGGLCGQSSLSNVTDCHSVGNVSGLANDVGGLMGAYHGSQAGYDRYGYMSSCTHAGIVTGMGSVGGLIGANWGGALSDCHHTGDVTGTDYAVGGFVGDSYGTYSNCWAIGDVSGTRNVGGMFGQHHTPSSGGPIGDMMFMTDLFHIGDVTGTDYYVGGFAGVINSGYFSRCNASGDVTGKSNVGGFVGDLYGGSLEYCMSTGTLIGTEYSAGGLIGYLSSGSVRNCFSSADVTGFSSVGGLIGNVRSGYIQDSHSFGSVTGDWAVGGLIGNSDGTVDRCYSTGRVSGTYGASGLVAQGNGYVYDSYWDRETSGTSYSQEGGSPRSTAQMKMQSTFVGWDFSKVWRIKETVSYPYLRTVHHPPIVRPMGEETAYEREPFSLDYEITISKYPAANVQTRESFTTSAGPWLSYDPALDRLNGTPTTDDIGTYWINISISDSHGGVTHHNVTFEVRNVNDIPWILTTPLTEATEDQEYSVDFEAVDIDPTNDTLVWSLETDVDWLAINDTTGVLNGTPTNGDVGAWNVTVTVSDGRGGLNHSMFLLVVTNVNDAPEITTEDVLNATEDEMYSVTYEAIDVDPIGDDLTWNYDGDAPWLTWNGAKLSGIPSNDDVGSYNIDISVSDGFGGLDRTTFTITVANVNDAPVITTEAVEEVTEDEEYRLELAAEDVDAGDTLTWELVAAPSWMKMDGGYLVGTPGNDDVSTHQVGVTVTDEAGESDSLAFAVTVINSNDAPVWTHVPEDWETIEGDPLLLYVSATDVDVGDTVGYGISISPGVGIQIDSVRGTISWLDPTVGLHTVDASATDGEAEVHHTFTITVHIFPNILPVIDPVGNRTVETNETLTFVVTGSDDDGDPLLFSLEDGPVGLVISSTGRLVWTPRSNQVGNHTVRVVLSDGRDTVTTEFTVNVTAPPPEEEPDGEEEADGGSDLLLWGIIVILLIVILFLVMNMTGKGQSDGDDKPQRKGEEKDHDKND